MACIGMIVKYLSSQQTLNKWFFSTKSLGKRERQALAVMFSLFNSLFFVERFVEKMLSLKYLIFNTSFIIFNNSTKLYAI